MKRLWLCYHICRAAYHLGATFRHTAVRCWYVMLAPGADIDELHTAWQAGLRTAADRKRSGL